MQDRIQLSSYVHFRSMDAGRVLVGHSLLGELCVLDGKAAQLLKIVANHSLDLEETAEKYGAALKFLRSRYFIVDDATEEDAEIDRRAARFAKTVDDSDHTVVKDGAMRDYGSIGANEFPLWITDEKTPDIQFLIVGGCLGQLAGDAIIKLAPGFGLNALVEMAWPSQLSRDRVATPDVLIFQPAQNWLLKPLWDNMSFLSDQERIECLEVFKKHIHLVIQQARSKVAKGLLLVHGFSVPSYPSLGMSDFRATMGFSNIVHELNESIRSALRLDLDAMFIDEELLVANVGKLRLMDDCVAPYSHHGPQGSTMGTQSGPSLVETFGLRRRYETSEIFARAYLDAYSIWSGRNRIKCIVVDLDNTLWPGEIANISDPESWIEQMHFSVYAGIHQALKVLRHRGILIAVCSRNAPEDAERMFTAIETFSNTAGMTHLLWNDDFVLKKVNWNSKVENIQLIANTLNLPTSAMLFIDDSPAERAMACAAYPDLRIIGENLFLVRSILLTEPSLQANVITAEAAQRTSMTRAQIERNQGLQSAVDETAFLRELKIRLRISRIVDSVKIQRVAELIQRTNQFNTTHLRWTTADIHDHLAIEENSIYVAEVSDRLTNYGLVGACIMNKEEVLGFVISCRVIPLRIEVPFLATALVSHGQMPIKATVIDRTGNGPCREVFRAAGFDRVRPGFFSLRNPDCLPLIDQTVYSVEMDE